MVGRLICQTPNSRKKTINNCFLNCVNYSGFIFFNLLPSQFLNFLVLSLFTIVLLKKLLDFSFFLDFEFLSSNSVRFLFTTLIVCLDLALRSPLNYAASYSNFQFKISLVFSSSLVFLTFKFECVLILFNSLIYIKIKIETCHHCIDITAYHVVSQFVIYIHFA